MRVQLQEGGLPEEAGDMRGPEPQQVLVVGVGGGGANVLANTSETMAPFAQLAVIDTDAQVLESCNVPLCMRMGDATSAGLSSGGDPVEGKAAAETSEIKLRELVANRRLVFLVTSLGGGTGTGAAPVVASIAREEGALVLCFAAMPFGFEGEEKTRLARTGLTELMEFCHGVVVLPNDRLSEQGRADEAMQASLARADEFMGECIASVSELLLHRTLINLDFADLSSIASHSGGTCCFGYGRGSGQHKIDRALRSLMKSPYFEGGKALAGAKGVLVAVRGGEDLTLQEVKTIVATIAEQSAPGVRIHLAAGHGDKLRGRVTITVLASESWIEEAVPDDGKASRRAGKAPASTSTTAKPKRDRKRKSTQTQLTLEPTGKGRFKDVEPTLYEGEDLDVPTFIRRDLKLIG